jgi:hypothetical protein
VNGNTLYNLGRAASPTSRIAPGLIDGSMVAWAVAGGWFDYDNDGWLDLFVVNCVAWDPVAEAKCSPPENRFYCHPNAYRGLPNQLFHNNRDGTFTDVSQQSGIAVHLGKGMGVTFADFDRDGYTDVFVANDSVRSFLFRNQGDGTFPRKSAWKRRYPAEDRA